jgi:hypothetical protein
MTFSPPAAHVLKIKLSYEVFRSCVVALGFRVNTIAGLICVIGHAHSAVNAKKAGNGGWY